MKRLLTNCTLIDGLGGTPVSNAQVLVYDDRIERVETGAVGELAPDTEVIDLYGGFLLPGLCSTHVHLGDLWPAPESPDEPVAERTIRAGRNAMDALRCGITSMRSLGEYEFIDVAWRRAFERRVHTGPTIMAAGNALIAPGGHAHFMRRNKEVRGVGAIRDEVSRQLENGVDCIKLVTTAGETIDEGMAFGELQFTSEEIRAVVDTAHAAGKSVCTHTGTSDGVKQAVEAGVDCIEHGYVMDQQAVDLLVNHDVFLTPTLSVTHNEEFYDRTGMAESQRDRFRRIRDRHDESFRLAYESGVQITCGADTNPIGSCTLSEIALMVDCGMSKGDAIVAATSTSATAIGVGNERGAIEVGKLADFVVLAGDPLEDIRNVWTTRLVIKGGVLVEPSPDGAKNAYWDLSQCA